MFPLLHLIKFRGGGCCSHSLLVDLYQIHVRNILLFSFGLSMARQVFGENIICHRSGLSISQSYVDTQCYINGTQSRSGDPIMNHGYYQWIAIVLLLMAFSVYFPFSLWFRRYGFFIKEISNLKDIKSCRQMVQVMRDSCGDCLFWKTFILEQVYVVYLILCGVLLNQFFNGVWSRNGGSIDTIYLLFPENGTCFVDYYSGGDVTTGKVVCLLPINSVYRKVFWILYVVAILMGVLHAVILLYRIFTVLRMGRHVDMFWTWNIAIKTAETWEVKHWLRQDWKNIQATIPRRRRRSNTFTFPPCPPGDADLKV